MAQLRKRRSAEHQQVTQPRADQITYDCGFANGYIQGFDDSQAGRPSRYAYPSPETTVVKHKDDLPVQVYTVREVATILKVNPRTIERLVATNQLVAIHVGRRLRVTIDQLHAYMHHVHTEALKDGNPQNLDTGEAYE
jgi:excisionase family DNA binding protein